MKVLGGAMRIQAISTAIYGVSYFFFPDLVVGTIFG